MHLYRKCNSFGWDFVLAIVVVFFVVIGSQKEAKRNAARINSLALTLE